VKDVMVPIKNAFCLDVDGIMDEILFDSVTNAGFSRLPVIEHVDDASGMRQATVVGLLHVKDLLVIDPASALPVRTVLALFGTNCVVIDSEEPILTLLRLFQSGTSQLACVKEIVFNDDHAPYWIHSGIVAVQDILKAIIKDDGDPQPEVLCTSTSKMTVTSAPLISTVRACLRTQKSAVSNVSDSRSVG